MLKIRIDVFVFILYNSNKILIIFLFLFDTYSIENKYNASVMVYIVNYILLYNYY